jgi:hypothetical protein
MQSWTGNLNVLRARELISSRRRFFIGGSMNYQAFTNDTLTMMYQGARGALAVDDALCELGKECRFRVRETPEWKKHAADLEAEMLRRGMIFDVIDWSEDLFTAERLATQ